MIKARAREAARDILRQAKINTPPVPVERLARRRGVEVRYEPLEGDLSGMLFREEGREIIGVNALHPKSRQRFTIAHELGHLELHEQLSIHVDRKFPVRLRDERSSQAVDYQEIEANSFAAELLMPAAMLKADLDAYAVESMDYDDDDLIHHLADRYKVSTQAMGFRLLNLGYQEYDEPYDEHPSERPRG